MRILIIDDDEELCQTLAYRLKKEGIATDMCYDGAQALTLAREDLYDLILLDRMLPSLTGTEFLRRFRGEGHQTPVILVTALGEIHERVEGLDLGADDYLVKPIAFDELMARIRSIRRRPQNYETTRLLTCGDLSLDPRTKLLACRGKTLNLSKTEGELLEEFMRNNGRILNRKMILLKVWGIDTEVEEGNLDNYIHFLRRRLKSLGSTAAIRTIRGIGYTLEA